MLFLHWSHFSAMVSIIVLSGSHGMLLWDAPVTFTGCNGVACPGKPHASLDGNTSPDTRKR